MRGWKSTVCVGTPANKPSWPDGTAALYKKKAHFVSVCEHLPSKGGLYTMHPCLVYLSTTTQVNHRSAKNDENENENGIVCADYWWKKSVVGFVLVGMIVSLSFLCRFAPLYSFASLVDNRETHELNNDS